MFEIFRGDCLQTLRGLPDNSIDSIVTDPPYGLSFMGKRWDYDVPTTELWAECLRVLKPGGHLLAFAGTRTQHRMAVRIEDAGFEIRDMIAWVYGSGFPKSRDVSDAMAKYQAGEVPVVPGTNISPDVYQVTAYLRAARDAAGWTNRRIDELFGTNGMAGHWTTAASQPAVPSVKQWAQLKAALGFGDELDALVAEMGASERPEGWGESSGERDGTFLSTLGKDRDAPPAGDWGTALKPALEPVTVARKPPLGSVTGTVLAYGTGALNIGGCRIPAPDAPAVAQVTAGAGPRYSGIMNGGKVSASEARATSTSQAGRWPANLLHDGGDEVTDVLGNAARFFYCPRQARKTVKKATAIPRSSRPT